MVVLFGHRHQSPASSSHGRAWGARYRALHAAEVLGPPRNAYLPVVIVHKERNSARQLLGVRVVGLEYGGRSG